MRLSLRWKIVGGFGALLVLIVLLGSLTLSLFNSLRSVQRRVFDDAIPGLVAVDELVRSYTAQSAAVRGFLINSELALLDQYRQEVAASEVWQERARELFTAGRERELLRELAEAGGSFQQLVEQEVVPLASRGHRTRAFFVLGQQGTPLVAQVTAVGELLRRVQDEKVAGIESELRTRSNRVLVTLLLVSAGALLIGGGLAIDLPRRLVADLSALVDAARRIGAGDFDQRIRIRSGDEVEELAVHFEEMQAGLKRLRQLASQDRELEIAAAIQRNLLPKALPEVGGVRLIPLQRQANLVGGDWYDVDYSRRALTVVVGDASGKGIGAALMATVALSVLRAEQRLGVPPQVVVERTNEALREATQPHSFTTMLYATVDVAGGVPRWLNMGHPSPFVLRGNTGDGSTPRGQFLDSPRNRALGWFENPGFEEGVMRLRPGDRLVFFTDGFLEAKSPEGEVFGEHRLGKSLLDLSRLDEQTMVERLVEEVERFAAGKLDDDLTMLIAAYQGAPSRVAPVEEQTGEPWHSRR